MNTVRTLYYLARADFLERSRRYSFLVTLGFIILIAYAYLPPKDAASVTFSLDSYRGIYNSAWVGAIVAVLCAAILSIPGFFLVKNTVERDTSTRVGQILATTPISRAQYILGKLFSNFVFLSVMVVVIMAAAQGMQWVRGEDMQVHVWQFTAPFLFITLPVMALVSAIALLFEVIPWLRGGFGNILYLVLYMVMVMAALMPSQVNGVWHRRLEPFGLTVLAEDMGRDVKAVYPDYRGGLVIGATSVRGETQTFVWDGVSWDLSIAASRFLWLGVALGIALFASLLFTRFDPALERGKWGKAAPQKAAKEEQAEVPEAVIAAPLPMVSLTPVPRREADPIGLLLRSLVAEMRIMLKGIRWWWYAVAAGIILIGLFAPGAEVSKGALLAAWIWPVLIWSGLGCREKRYHTNELVFSAAHPLLRQLPSAWLGGVVLALLMASGPALRFLLTGAWASLSALLVGAVFIPSLALALGIWSGSSKLFEVVYLFLWYIGPLNQLPALDYMGITPQSIAAGVPLYFLAASALLLALSLAGRKRQILV